MRGADGFHVTQEAPSVYFVNDTADWITRTYANIECSYSDWAHGATSQVFYVQDNSDITKYWTVTVTCGAPTWSYDLTTVGWVPRSGQLFVSKQCQTTGGSPSNTSFTYQDFIGRSDLPTSSRRRLMAVDDEVLSWSPHTASSSLHHIINPPTDRGYRNPPPLTPTHRGPTASSHTAVKGGRGPPQPRIGSGGGWENFGGIYQSRKREIKMQQERRNSDRKLLEYFTNFRLAHPTLYSGLSYGAEFGGGILAWGVQAWASSWLPCAGQLGDIFGTPCKSDLSGILNQLADLKNGFDVNSARIDQAMAWQNGNFTLIEDLQNEYNTQGNIIDNNQLKVDGQFLNITDNIRNQINSTVTMITTFQDYATANFNNISQQIQQIDSEIAAANRNFGALDQQTKWDFGNLTASLQSVSTQVNQAIQSLSSVTQNNYVSTLQLIFSLQITVRTLAQQLVNVYTRADEMRIHRRNLRTYLHLAEEEGLVPFVRSTGDDPVLTYDTFNIELERTIVRYLVGGGGGAIMYERTLSFKCNANFVRSSMVGWHDLTDFMINMGPAGCSPDSATAYCNCYAEHSIRTCTVLGTVSSANSSLPKSYLNPNSHWRTAIAINTTLVCSGVVYAQSLPDRFNDLSQLVDLFQTIGQDGLYDPYGGGYMMYAVHTQLFTSTPLPYFARLVNFTAMDIQQAKPGEALMLPQFIMKILTVAYYNLDSLSDDINSKLDGDVIDGASYYDLPFALDPENHTARCSMMAFMGFETDLLPVIRAQVRSATAEMTIAIQEPDGGPTQTSTFTDTIIDDSLSILLPGDMLFVGSPFGDDLGLIYDVDQRDISIAPVPYARLDTVTALLCVDRDRCDPGTILADYGPSYIPDAFRLTNMASFYAQRLAIGEDGSFQCDSNFTAGYQSTCDVRWFYHMFPGNSDNTTMLMKATMGKVTGRVAIPSGTVTERVTNVCPVPSVTSTTSSGVTLTLSNQRPLPVAVIVYTYGDACDLAQQSLTIGGGGSEPVWIPSCPGGGSMFASVTLDDEDGTQCQNIYQLNVTAHPRSTYIAIQTVPDVPYVNMITNLTNDRVLATMLNLNINMATQMMGIMTLQMSTFQQIGAVSFNNTFSVTPYESIFNETAAAIQRAIELQNEAAANQLNLDAMAALTQRIRDLNAGAADAYAAMKNSTQAAMDNIKNAVAAQQNISQVLLQAQAAASYASELVLNLTIKEQQIESNIFGTIIQGFSQLSSSDFTSLGDVFGSLLKVPGEFVDGVTDLAKTVAHDAVSLVEDVANEALDLANKLVDKIGDFFGGLLGPIGTFIQYVVIAVLVCVALYAAYKLYPYIKKKCGNGKEKEGYTRTYEKPEMEEPGL